MSGGLRHPSDPPGRPANTASLVCLVLYCLAAYYIPGAGYLLAAPLGLAAFVMAIIGASKGDTARGVILIIASFTIPFFACVAGYTYDMYGV